MDGDFHADGGEKKNEDDEELDEWCDIGEKREQEG